MKLIQCDKCGATAMYTATLTLLAGGKDYPVFEADLCQDCANAMKSQILGMEVKDRE